MADTAPGEAAELSSVEPDPHTTADSKNRRLVGSAYTPVAVNGRHAVKVENCWGQRFTVSAHNLRGRAFSLDRDIAAHNGLQPEDSLTVPALHADTVVGEASLIWRLPNPQGTVDVGRLSTALRQMAVFPGDQIVIVATSESCKILKLQQVPKTQPDQSQQPLNVNVQRSQLGRK